MLSLHAVLKVLIYIRYQDLCCFSQTLIWSMYSLFGRCKDKGIFMKTRGKIGNHLIWFQGTKSHWNPRVYSDWSVSLYGSHLEGKYVKYLPLPPSQYTYR